MELKNPLLVPNKWLQRTSSQNQVLAELNLSKKPEIPQSGHQAGTGARILKCDATVRDHACRKKATELLSTTELPFLRTIFLKSILIKHFIWAFWAKICAHSMHTAPTCFDGS